MRDEVFDRYPRLLLFKCLKTYLPLLGFFALGPGLVSRILETGSRCATSRWTSQGLMETKNGFHEDQTRPPCHNPQVVLHCLSYTVHCQNADIATASVVYTSAVIIYPQTRTKASRLSTRNVMEFADKNWINLATYWEVLTRIEWK